MTSDSAYYSSVVPPFVKELRVAILSYSDSDPISYRGLLSSEFFTGSTKHPCDQNSSEKNGLMQGSL